MPDGTTFDMTAYREFDVLVSYRDRPESGPLFIDFRFADDET